MFCFSARSLANLAEPFFDLLSTHSSFDCVAVKRSKCRRNVSRREVFTLSLIETSNVDKSKNFAKSYCQTIRRLILLYHNEGSLNVAVDDQVNACTLWYRVLHGAGEHIRVEFGAPAWYDHRKIFFNKLSKFRRTRCDVWGQGYEKVQRRL